MTASRGVRVVSYHTYRQVGGKRLATGSRKVTRLEVPEGTRTLIEGQGSGNAGRLRQKGPRLFFRFGASHDF